MYHKANVSLLVECDRVSVVLPEYEYSNAYMVDFFPLINIISPEIVSFLQKEGLGYLISWVYRSPYGGGRLRAI